MGAADQRRLLERHRLDLAHLTDRVRTDLAALLSQVRGLPVAEVRNILIRVMPDVVGPYMAAAGEISATWYEDLRLQVSTRGVFYAQAVAPELPQSQAAAVARWAVAPLVAEDVAGTLTRLGGSAQKIIFNSARGVIDANASRDRLRVTRQSMPRRGCCSFCGRNAARGGGHFHDDCYCIVAPVFDGSAMAELARAEAKRYRALDASATRAADGDDAKSVLSAWRSVHGTN